MSRVKGKVAIVTGAASGQGAAEAKLLAEHGAFVIATDINEEGVQAVVKEINQAQGEVAHALKHDVASEADWKAVVDLALKHYDKVDVLVNNAGIGGADGFMNVEQYDYDGWKKFMTINADSQFLGTQAVVPAMKKAGQGSIINISSIAGLIGGAAGSHYSASKGAIKLFTKATAVELAQYKIRVNSVHPGFIDTPMVSLVTSDKAATENVLQKIPLKTIGKPEDVAYLVLFLASDESKYITAAEIVIDGGITQFS